MSGKKKNADLTLQTINSLRSENEFEFLWQKTVEQAEVLEITQPSFPRKRKRPAKFLNVNEVPLYDEVLDVKTFYRRIYFNAIDTVTSCIKT